MWATPYTKRSCRFLIVVWSLSLFLTTLPVVVLAVYYGMPFQWSWIINIVSAMVALSGIRFYTLKLWQTKAREEEEAKKAAEVVALFELWMKE